MARVDNELEKTLQRIKEGKDAASDNQTPLFDPKQHREVVAHSMGGRKPDSYRTALEFHGFRFHPRVVRGDGVVESQWRHPDLKFAFTDQSVVSEFKTPEDLDIWLRQMKAGKLGQRSRR